MIFMSYDYDRMFVIIKFNHSDLIQSLVNGTYIQRYRTGAISIQFDYGFLGQNVTFPVLA